MVLSLFRKHCGFGFGDFVSYQHFSSGHVQVVFVRWFLQYHPSHFSWSIDRCPYPWSRFGLRSDEKRRYWVSVPRFLRRS